MARMTISWVTLNVSGRRVLIKVLYKELYIIASALTGLSPTVNTKPKMTPTKINLPVRTGFAKNTSS